MEGFPCTYNKNMGTCQVKLASYPPNRKLDDDRKPGKLRGNVHMLVMGLDYACDNAGAGLYPLDTRKGFDAVLDLGRKCEVSTLVTMWNEQCTKANTELAIKTVGAKCKPGDHFFLYYTGQGDQLETHDGDDEPIVESAFCLVGEDGNLEPRHSTWMTDDDLANTIQAAVTNDAKVILLADCWHSGSILNAGSMQWHQGGYTAFSLTGCQNKPSAAGSGSGIVFTRSLMAAVQALQNDGPPGYTLATLYNECVTQYMVRKHTGHTTTITVNTCGALPKDLVWPLQPKDKYFVPVN